MYLSDVPNGKEIERRSFGNVENFVNNFKAEVDDMFAAREKSFMEPKWIKCQDQCQSFVKDYVTKEMKSTAYMLRCLELSLINAKLDITCSDLRNVTGIWEEDKRLFRVNNFEQDSGRLIMGFGPSASGKTYWAKNIIGMLGEIEPGFPKVFLSIDGGIYREASVIYQTLIKTVIEKNIGGLSNLVAAGFSFGSSIFSAGKIKRAVHDFMKSQRPPNLYVPETLGSCKGTLLCKKKYNKYQKMTKDKDWTGLCIWQHVEDTLCVFGPEYKCIGCKESGKQRERREGKKYSADAWKNSFSNGISSAKRAKKWFIIHNTGGRTYKIGDRVLPCINLIESNVDISKAVQVRYNCEVYKEIKVKV